MGFGAGGCVIQVRGAEGPSDNRLNRSRFRYPQALNFTCDCVQPLFRHG